MCSFDVFFWFFKWYLVTNKSENQELQGHEWILYIQDFSRTLWGSYYHWHFSMQWYLFNSWTKKQHSVYTVTAKHTGTSSKKSGWTRYQALIYSSLDMKKLCITWINVSVVLIILWRNRWFIHYPYSDKYVLKL